MKKAGYRSRSYGGDDSRSTNDPKYRSQRNDNRPRNITKLQGRSGTLDQRFVHLGLCESAIMETTRTVRDNNPNGMDINQLYSLFRLHFIPERNKFHSRADFFGITREKHETAEDVWTRILQVEKNCEVENVTSRIDSIEVPVCNRQTNRRLQIEEENLKKRHDHRNKNSLDT